MTTSKKKTTIVTTLAATSQPATKGKKKLSLDNANLQLAKNAGQGHNRNSVYKAFPKDAMCSEFFDLSEFTEIQKSEFMKKFRNKIRKTFWSNWESTFLPAIKEFKVSKKVSDLDAQNAALWIKNVYLKVFLINDFSAGSVAGNDNRATAYFDFMNFMKFVNENFDF